MSYRREDRNTPADVRFKPAGTGLVIRANCMGCGQHRSQSGGKGQPGPRWRCAECVAAKAGRAQG